MSKLLPDVSKEVRSDDIRKVLDKNYATIIPVWTPLQLAWVNNVYRTFQDYEKFMIVVHLITQTFEAYSKNFVKLNYDEYFDQTEVEIRSINVIEISKSLNIAKETTRRKINELQKMGAIKRINKKIIIDRKTWPNIKPQETIKRMSRFLSTLSNVCVEERLISQSLSSEKIIEISKEYFSYIWKLYYEMQIPMLLGFKEIFGDLESFHVNSVVVINHVLNAKRNDNSEMSREFYLEKYFFTSEHEFSGVNAMSISEITGIPRATVIRKLNRLIKDKYLEIDSKKHYVSTGHNSKKFLEVQKTTLINLSKLTARVYNLSLMKNN